MSESKQFLNIIRIFDPDQQTELIEIMKQYNFDEIIERRGTNCVKYDLLKKDFGNENLVPLWVADMDFRTPDFIVNAIKKRLEHEISGTHSTRIPIITVSSSGYIINITGKSNANGLVIFPAS